MEIATAILGLVSAAIFAAHAIAGSKARRTRFLTHSRAIPLWQLNTRPR